MEDQLLKTLNQKLFKSLDRLPLGLTDGKMVFCLYFYIVGRLIIMSTQTLESDY